MCVERTAINKVGYDVILQRHGYKDCSILYKCKFVQCHLKGGIVDL
jgi:hypothetical protein